MGLDSHHEGFLGLSVIVAYESLHKRFRVANIIIVTLF